MLTTVISEQQDRERRIRIVIISGVQESKKVNQKEQEEEKAIEDIFNFIEFKFNPDTIVSCFRMKNAINATSTKPALVKLKDEESVELVLARAPRLSMQNLPDRSTSTRI